MLTLPCVCFHCYIIGNNVIIIYFFSAVACLSSSADIVDATDMLCIRFMSRAVLGGFAHNFMLVFIVIVTGALIEHLKVENVL